MTVICCGNVKGGVAKTTTAVQLALHAGALGSRVLLVDADPGRSALSWATRAGDWPHGSIAVVPHQTHDLPRRLPGLARGFDAVIIDTPHDPRGLGRVGPMLASALAVADVFVVPTGPNGADLDRLDDLLGAIDAEVARRDLCWMAALTMVDLRRRAVAVEVVEALEARGVPTAGVAAAVPQRAAVADAFGTTRVLGEYGGLVGAVYGAAITGAVA